MGRFTALATRLVREVFSEDTSIDPEEEKANLGKAGWKAQGKTWTNPEFPGHRLDAEELGHRSLILHHSHEKLGGIRPCRNASEAINSVNSCAKD